MKELRKHYSVEIDKVTKQEWSDLLTRFDDATIYQTWSYGAVRWGEKSLSHLLLKKEGEVVGMAQVSIKRIPFLPCGIAYVPWGPLWHKKGGNEDWEVFRQLVRVLRDEYATRRGLLLRIAPNEIESPERNITGMLQEEGYMRKAQPYRTILIDLSPSLEDLRKRLARRWRRALKEAESRGLQIMNGRSVELLDTLREIYGEMVSRKGFIPGVDIDEFCEIQKDLPENLKMKILVCEYGGKPVGAIMASLLGNKGIGLIGGSRRNGLNLGGFHLLNWRLIEWMKSQGANFYDFGGYDPQNNPGTASFKEGIGGKDVYHIGQFETSNGFLSPFAVRLGEKIRALYRKRKNLLASQKKSLRELNEETSDNRQNE